MRVIQIVAALEAAGMAVAGPLGHNHRHRHLHHLHHRSFNQTGLNTTDDAGDSTTVYADHIRVVTSTVDVTPIAAADGSDSSSTIQQQENLASSAVTADSSATSSLLSLSSSSSTLSLSSSSLSLSSQSILPLSSISSLVSSAPSDASTPSVTPTSDTASSSISVTIDGPSSTPTAVGVLSQVLDTTTQVKVETVYNTVTVNGIVSTHSASEQTKTVEDVVTNYVTATFSALTPFKNPVIKVAATSASSSTCSVKTTTITLPASKSPTLVAGGKTSSIKAGTTSKVSSIPLKAITSSKKASTSSKKVSTSSRKVSTSSKKVSTSSKKASTSSKKISTSSKKSSTSSKKANTSSTKKVSSSTKKAATTSSSKKVSTSSKKVSSSSKKSSSSMVNAGVTMKTTATSVKPSTKASSSTKSSSAACATAAAPAPTQTGIVSGCTKWYKAVSGDYCYKIANQFGIATDTFMSWNPSVNAPSCNNIQIGYAYCVATCSTGGSAASSTPVSKGTSTSQAGSAPSSKSSSTSSSGSGSASSSTGSSGSSPSVAPSSKYTFYSGNGTEAAGWPSQDQWLDFETLFAMNQNILSSSCANNGWGANNSPTEIANLKTAIITAAEEYAVDARFILAIVMQESNGCVRVVTTNYGVRNPGLMQDHNGDGTCNDAGTVQNPCPYSEIQQMIKDGTGGTASGDGLVQCLQQTDVTDVSKYYRAARIYNGGYGGYRANDLGSGCCTLCYSSDVANRLTGWSAGTSGCSL